MVQIKNILALAGALLMLGCSSSPVERPPLSFTKFQPIHMAVSSIEIVDLYKSPLQSPYVEHLIPYSPSEAIHIWVKDRLRAVGSNRTMQVIIKDGSVTGKQEETPGMFGFEPVRSVRYTAKLDVEMRLYNDGQNLSVAAIEVTANRSISVNSLATVGMRDTAFRSLISDMMTEVNAELEKDLFAYMGNYITYQN